MSFSNSIFYALLATFLLVTLAGSAFKGFQGWVSMQAHAQELAKPMPFISSGLRISSTPVNKATDESANERSNASLPPLKLDSTFAFISSAQAHIEPSETHLNSALLQPLKTSRPAKNGVVSTSKPEQTLNETLDDLNDDLSNEASINQSGEGLNEPTIVLYENEIAVEFPRSIADLKTIKKSLARLILSPEPFNEPLLSTASLSFKKTPFFYKQVLDHNGRAIRYPANALAYLDRLLSSDAVEQIRDSEGEFTVVTIPLTKRTYPKPIERYRNWVDSYGETFSVSPALIFAIMETESGFRPKAVSKSQAMGLMQVKAGAAGKDVFSRVDKKLGQPSHIQLFDEQENIRMGTAYLGLLNHDYLASVRNDENKELLTIASYNGGLSTVLKLFGETTEKALAQINRLHPRQVYRKLRFEHQSKETREYLDKVLQAKNRYQSILET